jgi:hypothetical protein
LPSNALPMSLYAVWPIRNGTMGFTLALIS